MKEKLKIYVPWVLLAVLPSVVCVALSAVQLYNASLFFGIHWDFGFYTVFCRIVADLVKLLRPLAGIFFCILAVLRPFSRKTAEFLTGLRLVAAAALALFAVSFSISAGIELLAVNTVWGWLANVLRVAVIPVAVAYLLVRHDKLPSPVRWTLAAVVVCLMVAGAVNTFTAAAAGQLVTSGYIVGAVFVTYCQVCPVAMALIPQKE